MAKKFGELFSESWKDYKNNYKTFFILILLLSFMPGFFLYIVSFPLNLEITNLGKNPELSQIFSVIWNYNYLVPLAIIGIISMLFSLLLYVSLIYSSLRKKPIKVNESLQGGIRYFWKYLLFTIVSGIFLFGLFLLLIIPGIIFLIYWIFSFYILIEKNKGILDSLKTSRKIVSGKWWRTFGFLLLFFLIVVLIMIPFSMVSSLIDFLMPFSIIGGILIQIINLFANFIIIPLGILFLKNFYLDMKKGK